MIGKKNLKNNGTIAPNVLYTKKEKIYLAKHNSNRQKQLILLMILNGEGWHYLAIKRLLALLNGITSTHHGDLCCLNCLYSFATENNEKNEEFCNINAS